MTKTIKRQEWIDTLRGYIGTPFLHQGRVRGVGVDCIGLAAAAANDLEIDPNGAAKFVTYSRVPHKQLFSELAPNYLTALPYNRLQPLTNQILPGDVIFFWIDKRGLPRHIGVYTGTNDEGFDMMIHAYAKQPRAVVEMPIFNGYWQQRIESLWTLPAFED